MQDIYRNLSEEEKNKKREYGRSINHIMSEKKKSFSPVTSTNVRISSQNFLTFSFNPFDRLV